MFAIAFMCSCFNRFTFPVSPFILLADDYYFFFASLIHLFLFFLSSLFYGFCCVDSRMVIGEGCHIMMRISFLLEGHPMKEHFIHEVDSY